MPRSHGTGTRGVFLRAFSDARPLVASEDVRDAWSQPSALAEMSVGALAAHLSRALFNVERYLDVEPEEHTEEPIPAAAYYASVLKTFDIQDPINVSVRTRSDEEAAEGWEALVRRYDGTIERLKARLSDEDRTRSMKVFGGLLMYLDDYLVTRIVECVVHTDDLAASLDVPPPDFDPGVLDLAITHMVDVARIRHGDLGVVRSLARRERDEYDSLRVF